MCKKNVARMLTHCICFIYEVQYPVHCSRTQTYYHLLHVLSVCKSEAQARVYVQGHYRESAKQAQTRNRGITNPAHYQTIFCLTTTENHFLSGCTSQGLKLKAFQIRSISTTNALRKSNVNHKKKRLEGISGHTRVC